MSTSTTGIEWADATWNPTRGCSRISTGCEHCYAETMAARFVARTVGTLDTGQPIQEPLPFHGFAEIRDGRARWTGRVSLVPSALDWPLRWRGSKIAKAEGRPSRIFVNSMSDLFHESLSDEDIAAVFGVMAAAPQHTFLVLTKRAERMRRWFEWLPNLWTTKNIPHQVVRDRNVIQILCHSSTPLSNVWLGVSVENQATADERIPHLLATLAAVRFVSYEPALGPVDFSRFVKPTLVTNGGRRLQQPHPDIPGEGGVWEWGLGWLIVGGESGPGARTTGLGWIRDAVSACREAAVPCFVKQVGAHVASGGSMPDRPRDRKGGDPSEWTEDLRVREFPAVKAD